MAIINKQQKHFLETYYTSELGKKVIICESNSDTSFCRDMGNYFEINVSVRNIENINVELRILASEEGKYVNRESLYYTLMLHEIGHALYSDMNIFRFVKSVEIRDTLNALEDNRIEHIISKWNVKVNFKLLRYVMQDKLLDRVVKTIKDYSNIAIKTVKDYSQYEIDRLSVLLMLTRAIDNRKYAKIILEFFGDCLRNREILKLILTEAKEFVNFKDNEHQAMVAAAERVSNLIDELYQNKYNDENKDEQQPKPKPEPKESSEEQANDKEGENEENEENGENGETEKETEAEETEKEGDSGEGSELEEDGEELDEFSKKFHEVSDALEEMFNDEILVMELEKELNEIATLDEDEFYEQDIRTIENPNKDTTPYTRYKISLFDTKLRSGIKGSGTIGRSSGSAQELNLNRYSQRKFSNDHRVFDKKMQDTTGGAKPKIMFYLDVSGSMSVAKYDYETEQFRKDSKPYIPMINYIKSFYDAMHKYVDIRIYVFNHYTSKIGRDELNETFFSRNIVGGSTIPRDIKLLPEEELIILTDGEWDRMPEKFKDKAQFIILGKENEEYFRKFNVKNMQVVDLDNLVPAFEKATQVIKRRLK